MSKIVASWFVIDDAFDHITARFQVHDDPSHELFGRMTVVQRPMDLGYYPTLPKDKKGFPYSIKNSEQEIPDWKLIPVGMSTQLSQTSLYFKKISNQDPYYVFAGYAPPPPGQNYVSAKCADIFKSRANTQYLSLSYRYSANANRYYISNIAGNWAYESNVVGPESEADNICIRWFVIDDAFSSNQALFEIKPDPDDPLNTKMSFNKQQIFLREYQDLPEDKKGFQFLINNTSIDKQQKLVPIEMTQGLSQTNLFFKKAKVPEAMNDYYEFAGYAPPPPKQPYLYSSCKDIFQTVSGAGNLQLYYNYDDHQWRYKISKITGNWSFKVKIYPANE